MQAAITVKNLVKSYSEHKRKDIISHKAVDDISFKIFPGEVIGLLGPNGAGKSTTINMLSSLLEPDYGLISILGFDSRKNKKKVKENIGVVPQDLAIYEEISAEKNVRFFGSLHGLKGETLSRYVSDALNLVSLYNRKDEKPISFSGGMKRRLNIACGIVHKPKIIIMDEPTVGIDPQSRNHILESIKILKGQGVTLIYSTHYMEEVEAIADRILILNDGKIIAEGTKESLTELISDQVCYSFVLEPGFIITEPALYAVEGVKKVTINPSSILVTATQTSNNLNNIITVLFQNNCILDSMASQKPSLETVFLELTGRTLRD